MELTASDIYTPSMPDISHYFGVGSDAVQTTLTAYFIGAGFAVVGCGFLADSLGERRLMLWGIAIAIFGALVCFVSSSNEILIFGRFLQGFGGSILPVIGWSVIQKNYPSKEVVKIFSIMGMLLAISPAIAPALGGWLNSLFGWRINFGVMIILLLPAFLLIQKNVPRDQIPEKLLTVREILRAYGQVLSHRQFLSLATVIPFFFAATWFFLSFLPFYTHEVLGIDSALYGAAISLLPAPGVMLGNYSVRYLPGIIGDTRTMYLGVFSGMLSPCILFGLHAFSLLNIWNLCGSLALIFFGMGLLFPTTVPRCLALFQKHKSMASSARGSFIIIGGLIGSVAAEIADERNFLFLCGFLFLMTLLSALSLKIGLRE